MAILRSDLKFFRSERMTDFSDGGGRMSATQVVDGEMNNVFQDQSDLDRINGRVSLRKVFFSVDTNNADMYLGGYAFLSDPPADALVNVVLFNTASATDERAQARSYVENYRVKTNKTQFVLYGNHLAGQSTVQVYCRKEIPTPDIGTVLCLSVEAAGYAPAEQYVAVREILSRQTVQFWDGTMNADFERDVLVLSTTTALTQAFPGRDDPIRAPTAAATVVRATQVLDAASYYGVFPLTDAADDGDLLVKIASPYVAIVPTTTAQTPLVDQIAGLGSLSMIPSGDEDSLTWSGSITAAANVPVTRYLGTPFARRSLFVTVGSTQLRDDGTGGIVAVDVGALGWFGEVDYDAGSFSIARDVGFSGSVSVTATPAGAVLDQSMSFALPITGANRNTSYVFQLSDAPAPGTATLDYKVQGNWIRLRDNGAGQMLGNAGEGSGPINYATGSIAITLGALPDVDSAIILGWGTDLRAKDSSGDIVAPMVRHRQQLDHTDIDPGTLSMSWESGSVAKTATATAAGVLSGDATGTVDHVNGFVLFSTTAAPDGLITYSYDYSEGVHTEVFHPTLVGATASITLGSGVPVAPGSVSASWISEVVYTYGNVGLDTTQHPVSVRDNGAGAISVAVEYDGYGSSSFTGTVNYATGAISLDVEAMLPTWVPELESRRLSNGRVCVFPAGYTLEDKGYSVPPGFALNLRWQEAGAGVVSTSEGHPLPAMKLYLGNGAAGPAVSGSLRFTFRGRTYVDRAGSLVYDVNPTTNAGTLGGSFDYGANVATITAIGAGNSNTVTVHSMLTRWTDPGVSGVLFRTPGAPLAAGNFTVQATTMAGTNLTATADINGVITGTQVAGTVDWTSGAVSLQFGALVTAAGNESEPWYDAAAVVGGNIWKPTMVDPVSVLFGCVVHRQIPVNPEIIGIDPVRLPSDGRVLGIRAGNTIIVHETSTLSVASPVAGAEHDLGTTRLSFIEVIDAAGVPVESVWYTLDLDAGTLTWANPLNLSAYTLPVTLRWRFEDASICSDVQVTGDISLSTPLTHDFTAAAQVSACVIYGDMQARVTNLFDQATYAAGVWSDVLIGSAAAGTYNDVTYPIEVDNDSAIDERWALVFTGSGTVNVLGETVGQVLTGASIDTDIAPVNPVSGEPFFVMDKDGFGGGWAAQNLIRFNTVSATRPTWAARVTRPGPASETDDSVRIQVYGNASED